MSDLSQSTVKTTGVSATDHHDKRQTDADECHAPLSETALAVVETTSAVVRSRWQLYYEPRVWKKEAETEHSPFDCLSGPICDRFAKGSRCSSNQQDRRGADMLKGSTLLSSPKVSGSLVKASLRHSYASISIDRIRKHYTTS